MRKSRKMQCCDDLKLFGTRKNFVYIPRGGCGVSRGIWFEFWYSDWWRKNPSVVRFWPLAATSRRRDLAAISPYCMGLEAPVAASAGCDPHIQMSTFHSIRLMSTGDLPFTNIRTLQPDPHGLDGDSDGVGCES